MHRDSTLSPISIARQETVRAMESRAGKKKTKAGCALSPPWTPFPHRTPKRLHLPPYPSSLQPRDSQTQWSKGTERYLLSPLPLLGARGGVGGQDSCTKASPVSQRRSRESASHGCWAAPTTMPQPRTLETLRGAYVLFDTQVLVIAKDPPLNLTPWLGSCTPIS